MEKINYKYTFILLFVLSIVLFLGLFYFMINSSHKNDINKISSKNLEEETYKKEKELLSYIENYKVALNAISNNRTFQVHLDKNNKNKEVSELLLTLQETLPSVFQIRLLDMNGIEKIRVESTISGKFSENTVSYIVPKERLQDKSSRYYIQKFKELDGEVGFSKLDLEKDFGKLVLPKKLSLRLGKTLKNSSAQEAGILIINVDFMKFLELYENSGLYDVMIVNKKGEFILHSNSNYGIVSDTFKTYLLKDAFPNEDIEKILNEDEYFSDAVHSKRINSFTTGQDLKLILGLKYKGLLEENSNDQKLFYLFLFLLIIVFLPLAIYFSKIPDRLKNKLKFQMITDNLTGLSNKEGLLYNFDKNKDKNKVVILIEIDNFSKIANAYGYKVAKQLIKSIAKFLSQYKGYGNFIDIYRIEKNSFGFIYNFDNNSLLDNDLAKLHKDMENEEFTIRYNFRVLVECSIGVSSILKTTNILKKIQESEIALETAHVMKKDICIYNKSDKRIDLNKDNIRLANKIKKSIENDNILVHFQAIYNNRNDCIEKYETLVRLKYESEIIYPDDFLSISKDIKKYKKLTKIVIAKSFEYFKDKNVEFSINLSIEDISSDEVRKYLFDKINEYNIGSKLVVEIVESEAIDNYDEFLSFIKEVKKLGCKIAIDDFGSGYSNYQYIINLNEYIDYLKIDGSLIKDIHLNRKTQLLVGTLKFLCDNLGIKTIAEYIENKEIFDYVKSMGINYSQGYYIGKPSEKIEG